jgi:transcriptional regulator with XRE-family HTH domain
MISAQHLRMARAGLGWTLIDLAERSGVNPNTISRYETGREGMSAKLRKLEAALRAAGVIFGEDNDTVSVQVPLLEDGKKAT